MHQQPKDHTQSSRSRYERFSSPTLLAPTAPPLGRRSAKGECLCGTHRRVHTSALLTCRTAASLEVATFIGPPCLTLTAISRIVSADCMTTGRITSHQL